jgi:hypothetical protein
VSGTPREINEFWQGLIEKKSGECRITVADARVGQDGSAVTILQFSRQRSPSCPGKTMKCNRDGELLSVFKRQPAGTRKAQAQYGN